VQNNTSVRLLDRREIDPGVSACWNGIRGDRRAERSEGIQASVGPESLVQAVLVSISNVWEPRGDCSVFARPALRDGGDALQEVVDMAVLANRVPVLSFFSVLSVFSLPPFVYDPISAGISGNSVH
jgi:hypothetical protein